MDLGEEPEAKSAPFVARVARQMEATVFGLVILPAVSDGAAKCAKAIETLQNLAANADAVFAFRKDMLGESIIPRLNLMFGNIDYVVNRLIKEERREKADL